MGTALDYVEAPTPDDCKIKISPSAFAKFISEPWSWYRQQVMGLDVFEYNTSSVIGTIVHYVAEQLGLGLDVDEDEINKYIDSLDDIEGFDRQVVRDSWYAMAAELVNSYTIKNRNKFCGVEKEVCSSLGSGVYVAGTADFLEGTKEDCLLGDYKTYNSKTKPKAIPSHYRYQLLTYAYCLGKLGYNVTRVRLVYVNRNIDGGISEKTNKPLKSYPPETTVLTESIEEADLKFIESMLMLCKASLEATERHPELKHIIWHDPRLKG